MIICIIFQCLNTFDLLIDDDGIALAEVEAAK